MNGPRTYFLPLFIVTAMAMTAAVIVAVYAARTAAVEHGVARAIELFREGKYDNGFAQLVRVTYWANRHPALVSHLRCAAIIGHARRNDDAAAIRLANRVLADDYAPPPPTDLWLALHQQAALVLDPFWLKSIGGLTPDPQAGYKTLMAELQKIDDAARLMQLEEQLARVFDGGQPHPVDVEPSFPAVADVPDADEPEFEPEAALVTPVPMPPEPAPEPPPPPAPGFGSGRFAVACGVSIPVYDTQGKLMGNLNPGDMLTVTDVRKIASGEIAICRREGAEASEAPMLVMTRDLIIRDGELAQLPDNVYDLVAEQGRLESEIRRFRRDAARQNPHAESYKKATADYKAFIARVKELTAARDGATGNERMRITNELQAMKNDEPALRSAYETAQRLYKEWKAGNGGQVESDPQVMALQDRLDKTAEQLAQYFDS